MAQYKVLAKSFINNAIREEGDIVEYDGQPGSNLELIESDRPAVKSKGKKGGDAPVDAEEQSGE